MIFNQAKNIMIGSQEVQKAYLGRCLLWQRLPLGLAPWGTSWNLYGVEPCEYGYLSPGIYLRGDSSSGVFMFTCAESPEKIDFTAVKSVAVHYRSTPGVGGITGGIAAIAATRKDTPKSAISYGVLALLEQAQTSARMDCSALGGEHFLLLYSDLDSALQVTALEFETYPAVHMTDLSGASWEQRNFEYESNTVITCNALVSVPADVSALAVHLSAHRGTEMKCCVIFLDETQTVLGYGDGWQGTTPKNSDVSSHFQEIPETAAYLQIAAGYAPNMTAAIVPQDLKSCVLCFS